MHPSVFEESTIPGTADAPEGAMQFFVERNMDGTENPSVIWVLPKLQTVEGYAFNPCKKGCGEHHPVVTELLSAEQQAQIAEANKQAGQQLQCVVCVCRGRLIE